MKLLLLTLLPCAALGFQNAAPLHYKKLDREMKLDRAEQCAEVYGYCDIEELESLAQELDQFQFQPSGSDYGRVSAILRSQSQLKQLMDGNAVSFERVNKSGEAETGDVFHDYLHYHW